MVSLSLSLSLSYLLHHVLLLRLVRRLELLFQLMDLAFGFRVKRRSVSQHAHIASQTTFTFQFPRVQRNQVSSPFFAVVLKNLLPSFAEDMLDCVRWLCVQLNTKLNTHSLLRRRRRLLLQPGMWVYSVPVRPARSVTMSRSRR